MARPRILGLDIRKRIERARALFKATGGKCIMDVPGEMVDVRMLMGQLADDAAMLLDAIEPGRRGD